MKINREEMLKVLESITPGLATKEMFEQSSCFAFEDGKVITFNDELCCMRDSPLKINGAVKAAPLLNLMRKLNDEVVDVDVDKNQMKVSAGGRKVEFAMEAEVMLPYSSVDTPEDWDDVNPEFFDAVESVNLCAGTDESEFELTCIHIHPDFVEACDRFRIERYELETGIDEETLVRSTTLKSIVGFGFTKMSKTGSWLHFKNPAGLVVAVRRFLDDYKNLDAFLQDSGSNQLSLPGNLSDAISNAEIFSSEHSVNYLTVQLKTNVMMITGKGPSGRYRERKKVVYEGPDEQFQIVPKMLLAISEKGNKCRIGNGKLFSEGEKSKHVVCTDVVYEE